MVNDFLDYLYLFIYLFFGGVCVTMFCFSSLFQTLKFGNENKKRKKKERKGFDKFI